MGLPIRSRKRAKIPRPSDHAADQCKDLRLKDMTSGASVYQNYRMVNP